jgi:ubiquinone/menaquinone biosynthesis C-methylase UbiE
LAPSEFPRIFQFLFIKDFIHRKKVANLRIYLNCLIIDRTCMNLEKHVKLFNRIAPVYSWFFNWQVKSYGRTLKTQGQYLDKYRGGRILDIGCGTGAFMQALKNQGFQATGMDIALSMLKQAFKSGQSCVAGNAAGYFPFKDNSFDVVTASYVIHGIDFRLREMLFREASRVSRGIILFHDFNDKRHFLTDFIEWMEGGDYFNFIKHGKDEMKNFFSTVDVISVAPQNSWYICTP